MSFADAAAHVGHRSRSSLYRLKADGRLASYLRPGGRGGSELLELEPPGLPPLREWIAATLRPQAPPAAAAPAAAAPADPAVVAQGLAALVRHLPEDEIPTLAVSRERREHYSAELARLEALERRGRLVDAEQVKSAAFAAYRQARDQFLGLPTKLAPQLIGLSDYQEAYRLLDTEIRHILTHLADQTDISDDDRQP